MKLLHVVLLLIASPGLVATQTLRDWNPYLSLGTFKFSGSGPGGTQKALLTQRVFVTELHFERKSSRQFVPAVEVGFINLKTKTSKYDHWKPFYFGYRHVLRSQLPGPFEGFASLSLGVSQTKYINDNSDIAQDDRQDVIDAFFYFTAMRPYTSLRLGLGAKLGFGITARADVSQRLYHIGHRYRWSNAALVSIGWRKF